MMKRLKKIKDSLLSRQIATAKISYKTARDFYKNKNRDSLKDTLKGAFQCLLKMIVNKTSSQIRFIF